MRFAYIDSNGNEVPIPSVDALALRIELGAIGENTELYDAQADQWGPAHTHEIFHSLSRAAAGDEGFVAPAPMVPEPQAEPEPDPEPLQVEAAQPEPAAEPEPVEAPAAAVEAPAAAEDLGLTLADPVPTADAAEDTELTLAEPVPEEESGLGMQGLDLAPAADSGTADDGPLDLAAAPDVAPEPEAGSFDFGDLGGGLELEAAPGETVGDGAMDFSAEGFAPEADTGEASLDFSGGMALDDPMEFGGGDFDAGSGGSLDLETPMSEFSVADPPSWMDSEGASTDEEEVLDFSAAGTDSDTTEVPLRDRRTPVNKPSKPKHRRQRNLAGPIVGIVILLAMGIGGYVAWPLISAQLFGSGEPEVPPVFLPALAEDLMPPMRAASDAAFAAAFEDVHRQWAQGNPTQSPSRDWLAGIYLANASDFEQVEAFWEGMSDLLESARDIDLQTFDAAYSRALQGTGVSGDDAALIRERADSGFVAAAAARASTFDRVERLIQNALGLHAFLLANEANIAYVPASNITTDPVLEANPSTPEIREAMEDRIDLITRGLADLGYLDLVTAQGLWARVLELIQANGVQ